MSDMDSKPDVSNDRIPDLIKIGAIPSSYGQMLHTDVIDPVTFDICVIAISFVFEFIFSNKSL